MSDLGDLSGESDERDDLRGYGEDDDIDYGDMGDDDDEDADPGALPSKKVANQHFDEAIDVSDEDEEDGDEDDDDFDDRDGFSHNVGHSFVGPDASRGTTPEPSPDEMGFTDSQFRSDMGDTQDEDSMYGSEIQDDLMKRESMRRYAETDGMGDESGEEGEEDEEGDDNVPVGSLDQRIAELASLVKQYDPQVLDMATTLKPFIPEFIPAVGDIDAFLKIPRPDGETDSLGLAVIDEPSGVQSDPTVLELQLRSMTKHAGLQPALVRSLDDAHKNAKAIHAWIESIEELHASKPATNVAYSKPMPEVEDLMQVWPAEFEEVLETETLPGPDIDMSVQEYARTVCAICDIPVYKSVVESLHVLFTLYSEFKANPHFQGQIGVGAGNGESGADGISGISGISGGAEVEQISHPQ